MSDRRKLGPVRQLSLQSVIRRPLLKKQLSVEHLENIAEHKLPGRKIESAKTNRLADRPRPIKVAWAESRQQSREEPLTPKSRFGDPVEVKKCKEFKRPVTAKESRLRPQVSLDTNIEKESILYTRQELAERLRKAWKDRVDNKQNLDIFLGNVDKIEEYEDNEVPKTEIQEEIPIKKPQKLQKQKTLASEFNYIPSTTASKPQDVRTNISVTIPIVMNQKVLESQPNSFEKAPEPEIKPEVEHKPKLVKQTSLINKENESVVKNLPQRPSTAAAKRESFQKRTNTAFTSTSTAPLPSRPPLNRTLSVPVKSDGQKLKFIASKRRLKSAARRKGKEEETIQSGDEDDEKEKPKKNSRCKSAAGELVTMVSLVSPAGSDNEEQEVKKEAKKEEDGKIAESKASGKKITKSVSFQQSSIHTVRSFSASFPSRRQVMSVLTSGATTVMATEREKRAPVESPPGPGDSRRHKRRLVRAMSVGGDGGRSDSTGDRSCSSFDEDQDSCSKTPADIPETPKQNISGVTRAEILPQKRNSIEIDLGTAKVGEKNSEEGDEEHEDPSIPKFESNKERECWVMYKKMSDKGLPVSYDTILRGMLTPTEYRSIRKEIKLST